MAKKKKQHPNWGGSRKGAGRPLVGSREERIALRDRMIKLRKEKGLSRPDMADALKVPYRTYYAWETSDRYLPPVRISEVINEME